MEAGTLRRQLAGLRAESERAAQVGFLFFSFFSFSRFLVFSYSRVLVLYHTPGMYLFFVVSRVFEFCRRLRGDSDRVLVASTATTSPPPRALWCAMSKGKVRVMSGVHYGICCLPSDVGSENISNIIVKATNSPKTQGQPNPRKTRFQSGIWATFSHSK